MWLCGGIQCKRTRHGRLFCPCVSFVVNSVLWTGDPTRVRLKRRSRTGLSRNARTRSPWRCYGLRGCGSSAYRGRRCGRFSRDCCSSFRNFGVVIAVVPPALIGVLSSDHMHFIYVLILFAVIMVVDGFLLQPYFMRRT